MGIRRKRYGSFNIKQKIDNDVILLYRIFFLLAAALSPVFSFIIFNYKTSIQNIYIDLSITISLLVIAITTFFSSKINQYLKELLFGFSIIISLYVYLIYADSGYTYYYFIGFILAYTAFLIGFSDFRFSIAYSVLNIIMVLIIQNYIFTEGNNNQLIELSAYLILSVIAFYIHYNNFKILKVVLFNEGLLNSIINSTDNAILLLDEEKNIIDFNHTAGKLFNIKNSTELIGIKLKSIIKNPDQELKDGGMDFSLKDNLIIQTEAKLHSIKYREGDYIIISIKDIRERIKQSTELKLVKDQLLESEKTYRELFDNSIDLLFIVDDKLNIIDVNNKVLLETNLSEDSIIGNNFMGLVSKDDIELFNIYLKKQNNQEFITLRILDKKYDINFRKTTYFEIDHIVISARSAENRIKYERELQHSRDQMKMVLENINNIIFYQEKDVDGIFKIKYISPVVEKMLGLTGDEFIKLQGSPETEKFIHKDDLHGLSILREKIYKKHEEATFTFRYKKNGEYIWLELNMRPKFNNAGEHIANFAVATDVTQTIRDKQALELSHRRNKEFIDRNLAGFFRLDLSKNILDCNDAFARIFGYQYAQQLIGKNVNEIYLDSTDRDTFIDNLRKKRNIINNESQITLINNKVIWVLENASLVLDTDNNEVVESTIFDITDLKRAEIALEKSEETLSLILSSIEDLIYNVDLNPDGTKQFNYIGNQVRKITGYTKEEYIKIFNDKTIVNRIHPEDLDEVNKRKELLKKEKVHQEYLYRFRRKNNTYVWLEENVFPQFDKDGRLIKLFGVVREVSERKLYEQELIKSKESYQLLFEKNMAGVFRTRLNGEILECNEAFLNIFGYESKEELLKAKSGSLYFSNEEREAYLNNLKKSKVLFNYELLNKKKNGSKIWTLVNVSLVLNNETKEELIQGTLIDITQIKLAGEAIAENEEKFRLLFEATNDAIFILDEDQIIDCNNKSLEVFNCPVNQKDFELNKKKCLFELSPETQPDGINSEEKIIQKITETYKGHSQMFYWRFLKMDGEFFDAEVSMNVFQLNGRNYIQTIIRDITARMKAEQALRESEDRFKMISNATIEGIIFTENGIIADANEQFAFLYGYESRKEIIGKNIDQFLYSQEDLNKVNSVINKGSDEKFEVRSKKKDGSMIWVESKGRFIPYHGKKLRVSMVYDITERKIKEQELRDSRESFMNLTEHSPNGSIIHIDGIIKYANPSVLKFLGFESSQNLIGRNIIEFLPADEQERSRERIEKIKKGENVGYAEFIVKNNKNKAIEIGVQSVQIVYNSEEAIHVIIIDLSKQKELQKEKLRAQLAEETNKLLEKEIQERKEAELRLWETQMFTTNMFNSSMDMIMASDRNNHITQVNVSALKIFGYKTEELIGMNPAQLYSSPKEFERISKALLAKGSFSGEITNIKKNGETFTSYLSASVLRNTQGRVIGTMGISRDITEQLRVEKKIQEQNAQIRSIFDSASNMLIWSIDKDFNLVSFNKNFSDIVLHHFGTTATKGDNIFTILKPFLREDLVEYSIQSVERTFKGENNELEGPFLTIKGNTIWIETFLNPIVQVDGSINEISCISHEITEKKSTESQIRLSLKEKEVLLKEVHHRVKNNLQVISSILNLQSSYVKDDQILSILRESQNRIKSMSYIHESLYQTKNFSSINFSEYIVNLSNNLFHSYQIFDNFIELRLDVGEVNLNLDQAIPCGLIVNEIITNALKYAFVGRKRGQVFVGIEEKENKIILRIEDDGAGLPKGFDYRKTDTLGLQLVGTLVEQLDGEMKLISSRGTKYLITFEKMI